MSIAGSRVLQGRLSYQDTPYSQRSQVEIAFTWPLSVKVETHLHRRPSPASLCNASDRQARGQAIGSGHNSMKLPSPTNRVVAYHARPSKGSLCFYFTYPRVDVTPVLLLAVIIQSASAGRSVLLHTHTKSETVDRTSS